LAVKIRKELATGRTFKQNLPLTEQALATKRAQLENYHASLIRTRKKNLKPVLDKINERADKTDGLINKRANKTDDLIAGVANLMLGHVDMGKMSREDQKASLRLQKMAIHNRNAQILAEEKAERDAKKEAERDAKKEAERKGKKGSKNDAGAFAEAVSSGAPTSSAPSAEVVEEQAVIEGEIYAALESDLGMVDPLHAQKESFKRKKLSNKLKVKFFKDLMLKDGPSTPFLDWVLMEWPDLHEQALNAAMAEHKLDNESA